MELDPPWSSDEENRKLFELATFAKTQSGADGAIIIYVKGPHAQLGWHIPPELYPHMPTILRNAYMDSFTQLAWVISTPGVQLPEHVREQVRHLLQSRDELKPN